MCSAKQNRLYLHNIKYPVNTYNSKAILTETPQSLWKLKRNSQVLTNSHANDIYFNFWAFWKYVSPVIASIRLAISRAILRVYLSFITLVLHLFFGWQLLETCFHTQRPAEFLHPNVLFGQVCLSSDWYSDVSGPPWGAVMIRCMVPGSYWVYLLKPYWTWEPSVPDKCTP